MASRSQALTVAYYAWDTVNAVPKTGDVANHTLFLVKDGGTPTAPTNSPTEISAAEMPGWYQVNLVSAETTANAIVLSGVSTSTGIVLCGTQATLEQLPTATPGATNGVFIAGTNAATSITGGLTAHIIGTVDTLTTYTGNTPQTGDSFARIGATGSGLTSLALHSDIVTLESQVGTPMQAGSPVAVNLGQNLGAARALDAVADTSLTLNDALHCAVAAAAGKESVSGTTYLIQTPSTGTVLRTFTLDSGTAPTQRT